MLNFSFDQATQCRLLGSYGPFIRPLQVCATCPVRIFKRGMYQYTLFGRPTLDYRGQELDLIQGKSHLEVRLAGTHLD